jgi:hypothetical protein
MTDPATPLPGPPSACLTQEQIAEARAAAPGQVPEPLARHLAGCERCQERLLFGQERPPRKRGRSMPELPSLGRALLLLALVVAAMAAFLFTLRQLAGRP